nr:hypothetical protein [Candidatus Kapabacteria bacterium]
ESDYFITFALITRDHAENQKHYLRFRELIQSYKFITIEATPSKDYSYDFGLINSHILDSLRIENKEEYLRTIKSYSYLEYAYRNNSKAMLDIFFNAWASESKPVPDEVVKRKTQIERDAYDIFQLFFKNEKLKECLTSGHDSTLTQNMNKELSSNVMYLLLQNDIRIAIMDSTTKKPAQYYGMRQDSPGKTSYIYTLSKIKILDFAPAVEYNNNKVIYCNETLTNTIKHFMDPNKPFEDIAPFPNEENDTEQRVQFFRQCIQLIQPWYGGYEYIQSVMHIAINLNSELTKADVYVKKYFGYYIVKFEKEVGNWVVKRFSKQYYHPI